MKKYLILLKIDFKNIGRDPMLIMTSVAPVLILLVMRLLVPFVNDLLFKYFSFNLKEYYMLIALYFSLIPGMLLGMTTAFLCLDEHDNQISAFFFVTPLMKRGYLIYRLSFPLLFSFVYTFIIFYINGLYHFTITLSIVYSLFTSLLSIFFFLALITFSNNKVEGLALGKALGIVILGPAAAYLLPSPVKYIGSVLPPFWSAVFFKSATSQESFAILFLLFILALFVHLIPLAFLYKRYLKKLD